MGRLPGTRTMPSATRTRRGTSQAIVAAIVGLAFVLQVSFVPLHLAWNDHVLPGASEAHVHTHGPLAHESDGHRHGGSHSESDDPESDHEPHPVADHTDQLAEPATPPTFGHTDPALAPRAFTILPQDMPTSVAMGEPDSCPRPPPPRDAAPARAPPIVA
jgi:hypothetical protein